MQEVKLNKKQEAFAQAYVKLGDASAAYREVYSYKNMKPEVIHVRACEMVKHSKVSVRINDLKSKIAEIAEKKFNITSEEMLRHLNILRSARIDEYVEFIEVEIPTTTTTGTGKNKVTSTTVDKRNELRFKTFDKLTEDQLMCIESVKQDRYGRVELKLHGKEWTIEKINKHIGFYEKDNEQKSNISLNTDDFTPEKEARLLALLEKASKSLGKSN